MEKVGNFIGRTIFGIISVAATAIVSVLVQRYMETITSISTPYSAPVPASAPVAPTEAEPIVPSDNEPAPIVPAEAIDTQPPEQVAEDEPTPFAVETQIDPSNPPVAATDPNDAPVQVLFEEEQNTDNSSNYDSDIMQTFWDKLKNK